MARDEKVTYSCDLCRKQVTAQQIRPTSGGGQPYYVRPPGWGAMSGIIQVQGDDKVKDKADFCSEECAREWFEGMISDAYSD